MFLRGYSLYVLLAAAFCVILLLRDLPQQRLDGSSVAEFKTSQNIAQPFEETQQSQGGDEKVFQKPQDIPGKTIDLTKIPNVYPESTSHVHEIKRLHEAAKAKHALKLKQQSSSLEAARQEYTRRYSFSPPDGYDKWFAYAVKHGSQIIDDFDDLMNDLRPWRGYQKSMCDLQENRGRTPAVMPICISNGSIDVGHPGKYDTKQIARPLTDFMGDFIENLPDMCFDINTFDEPRQLMPDIKLSHLLAQRASQACERYSWEEHKRENVWSQISMPCPAGSPALTGIPERQSSPSSYIEDWKQATDLCSWAEAPPSGMIRGPENLVWTNASRPILSAATLSTYSDIMFPTLWRWRFNIDHKKSIKWATIDDLTPWSDKKATVGWRGSSTGGFSSGENWRYYQRHQMVALANLSEIPTSSLNLRDPEQLQTWLDVRFTKIEGCETETCAAMEEELLTAPSQTLQDTFMNKIVLDMDGHGLSGRLYMLLQSDSAVMKQGIVREWHDERLVPWLHYIPLSMGMMELEGILEYFLGGGGDGDSVLETIAQEGKAWVRKAMRKEDMRIYMYRLLLELGRRTF